MPTYKVAQAGILSALGAMGFSLAPNLKIPHATSPDRETRLWFKPQAVYASFVIGRGGSHTFGNARSLHLDDYRNLDPVTAAKEMVTQAERWKGM
jgi:hypothetical protein